MTEEKRQQLTRLLCEKKKQEILNQELNSIIVKHNDPKKVNAASVCKKLWVEMHDETFKVIVLMDINNLIDCYPTYIAYNSYLKLCNGWNISPVKKDTFSKFVVKYFSYIIIDKRMKNKKYRLFIKS